MEPANGAEPLGPLAAACDSTAKESAADPELPMLYCPVCSQRLASQKCKLLCERCGYYMSCADYY